MSPTLRSGRSSVCRLVAAGLLSALLAGCVTAHATRAAPPASLSQESLRTTPAIDFRAGTPRPEKVLVVIEENHSQRSAMSQMPYLASLAREHGYTTAYRGVTHPSLPNYLAIFGGSTFGVRDDGGPNVNPVRGPSLLDTAIARGYSAKTYVQNMPTPCATGPRTPYAVKHNPWAYFTDATSRANCKTFDVPAGTTAAGALRRDIDTGMLPTLGLLIPDLCNDGHDCSLRTADTYVRGWLSKVLAGPDYRSGKLAVIVTFDEDEGAGDNTVLTAVISPRTKGVVSNTAFTHYSLARYFAQLIGANPPGKAATAAQLRSAFGI